MTFDELSCLIRCEQTRRGRDESTGSLESRRVRSAEKAEGGNQKIRKRFSEAETNPSTYHATPGQVSIVVRSHALRRRTSCQSVDHRGRRQLRIVDRHLRGVRSGKSLINTFAFRSCQRGVSRFRETPSYGVKTASIASIATIATLNATNERGTSPPVCLPSFVRRNATGAAETLHRDDSDANQLRG